MDNFPAKGYLYVACGKKEYFDEAIKSIYSLRQHDHHAHITLVCDSLQNISTELKESINHIVVKDVQIKNKFEGWIFKANSIYECSPYEFTLFLDTDTYIISNIRPLFDLLDYYEICLVHGSVDNSKTILDKKEIFGYTPYNTGVILYKKVESVKSLFFYLSHILSNKPESFPKSGDQHALMEALSLYPAKLYILQNNFNARFIYPERYVGKVSILHGGHKNINFIAEEINRFDSPRLWLPWAEMCLPEGKSSNEGYCLITTPNVHAIENRLCFLFSGELPAFHPTGDPTHISPILVRSIERMLPRYGLKLKFIDSWPHAAYFRLEHFGNPFVLKVIAKILKYFFNNKYHGDNLIMILQKDQNTTNPIKL